MNIEDRDGSLVTTTAHRIKTKRSVEILQLSSDILNMTIPKLVEKLGINTEAVKKQITAVKEDNLFKWVGPVNSCQCQGRG
jgi:predicted ArsR family transcriptional regulator